MTNWGVIEGYRFLPIVVTKTTEHMFWYREENRSETKAHKERLVAEGLTGQEASRLADRLTSARSERDRRQQAAEVWFQKEMMRLASEAKTARSEQ